MIPSNTESSNHLVERWISRILRFGVWGSAALMIFGLLSAWLLGVAPSPAGENPSPGDVLRSLSSGSLDPATLMFAGILLLMLTPFFRVLTAALGFAAEKDRTFTVVSLVIFAMLLGELIYSLG